MNDEVRLALLEALLARVRSRSRAPRSPAHRAPLRSGPFEIAPLPAAASQPPIHPKYNARPELPANLFATSQPEPHPTLRDSDRWKVPAQPVRARPAPPSEPAPAIDDDWTSPSFAPAAPPEPPPPEPPPMEVVELEIDPDPALSPIPPLEDPIPLEPSGQVPAPLESRSRLVAAAPMLADEIEPLEPLDDPEEPDFEDLAPGARNGLIEPADRGDPSDPTIEVAPPPVSQDGEIRKLGAEDDEAPSSSRRPISLEAKMSEPDDDLPPLHSPPPASGRLRAALPSLDLTLERLDEPRRVTPTDEPRRVTPTDEPRRVTPTDEPRRVTPTDEPRRVTPTDEPRRVTPTDEPRRVTPTDEPRRVTPTDEPRRVTSADEVHDPIEQIEAEPSGVSIIRVEPPAQDDVAVFVAPPKATAAKTFGELLEDALSI